MKIQLNKDISTLIGFCKNKNNWEPTYENHPYIKVFQTAKKYLGNELWCGDLFEVYLTENLEILKNKRNINDSDVNDIIENIENQLKLNASEVTIVFPLIGSTIKNSIDFGSFAIIKTASGNNTLMQSIRDHNEIYKEISDFSNVEIGDIHNFIDHTLNSSKDFLYFPLLLIKVRGQFAKISEPPLSIDRIRFYCNVLRLFCSKNKAKVNPHIPPMLSSKHYISVASHKRFKRLPSFEPISVNYDLSFLAQADIIENVKKIVMIYENEPPNNLRTLYLKSLKLFNWGLNGNYHLNDEITKKLLFFVISCESLLLFSTRGDKKNRLASIVNNFVKDYFKDVKNNVLEIYNKRNNFVHSAENDFTQYSLEWGITPNDQSALQKFEKYLAEILCIFPYEYHRIAQSSNPETYLKLWKTRTRYLSEDSEYNWIQKVANSLVKCIIKIFRL